MIEAKPCIDHVDTLRRYDNNSNFYDNNLEVLHGIIESNKMGKEEGKAIIIVDLVLGYSSVTRVNLILTREYSQISTFVL